MYYLVLGCVYVCLGLQTTETLQDEDYIIIADVGAGGVLLG